jgi:glycogen operon protein
VLALLPGCAVPLGASVDGKGINFALFSAHAERVQLCLFDAEGVRELHRLDLPSCTNDIWHGFLPDVGAGLIYGYRVYGPYDPSAGHRFNHHKLLIDPYARRLHGELKWSDANYGFKLGHADADLSFDTRDSAAYVPKCVVVAEQAAWRDEHRPQTPLSHSVIYEAHVKGMTQRFPGITASLRGTYSALAQKPVTRYLGELGITAIELLPIHGFVDDHFLVKQGLRNYWGYQSLTFLAPANRYSIADPLQEFRNMVRGLHRAGIEVLLDVVYNHTAEGSELGPTLCYRGIDNKSYYRLAKDQRFYVNDSGTGNTLNITQPRVLQLVMDSLRYWAAEMHVDGFRFDLASILGRELHGFDRGAGFFDAICQDPVLAKVKLIAEPWDIGPGGYQLGQYPAGWSEWNDQYRDTLRRFWSGEHGVLPAMSRILLGSSELFEWQHRSPAASINFVTAHDGFTLRDLVSYRDKHNEANGEDNRDGHGSNHSANNGVEGPSDDKEINQLRIRQQRNMLACLLLSQGVPMLLAGDEIGNSQQGNNNAYCQDNPIAWVDWPLLHADEDLRLFVQQLITLRRQQPVLRRPLHLHGRQHSVTTGAADVSWLNAQAEFMSEADWHVPDNQFLALQLAGDAEGYPVAGSVIEAGDSLLLLFNASSEDVRFPLQSDALCGSQWQRLLDSSEPGELGDVPADTINCCSHSVVVARCYTG